MKWYRVWMSQIEAIEIDKATEKTVTIKGRRFNRDAWQFYSPTWEEAHAHLLADAEARVLAARRSLELAQGYLGNAKGMKPPPPSTSGAES